MAKIKVLSYDIIKNIANYKNGRITNDTYYIYSAFNDNYRKGVTSPAYTLKNRNYTNVSDRKPVINGMHVIGDKVYSEWMVDCYGQPVNFSNVPLNRRITKVLCDTFPNEENCKKGYVLGYFKDEIIDAGLTETKDIYEHLLGKYLKRRKTHRAEKEYSYLQVAINVANQNQTLLYGEKKYTTEELIEGLCIMLYHTSRGIGSEKEVLTKLQKEYSGNCTIIEAPTSYERYDVDAIGINSLTKEPLFYISIKNGATLNPQKINTWRKPVKENGKGKDNPHIYAGYDADGYFMLYGIKGQYTPEQILTKGINVLEEKPETKIEVPVKTKWGAQINTQKRKTPDHNITYKTHKY